MEIKAERLLQASPEQIWQQLADLERWSGWMPGVKETALLSDQQEGVGRQQRLTVEGPFGHTEIEQEMIVWEPGRCIAWRDLCHVVEGVERNFMADVITSISLQPTNNGTLVTIAGTGRPLGALAWLLNLAMARGRVLKLFDKILDNLARISSD